MEVAIVIVLAIGFVAAVAYFNHDSQVRRALRKARLYSIAELPDGGLGRIAGDARPFNIEALTGPLTGRPCLYYICKVEERVASGKSSRWRNVITEARWIPFVVEDGTGRAIIDPTDAKISLDFDSLSKSGSFDDPTPIETAFLQRHGQQGKGWLFNKALRYREAIIGVGERVAVLGSGVREPDPDAPPGEGYRSAPATRIRLTSSKAHPLVISDAPDTTHS